MSSRAEPPAAPPGAAGVRSWLRSHTQRGVLSIPAFRKLWIALGLASLGDWLGLLALTALARSLYDDSYAGANFAVGGILLLRVAPAALFGSLAGVAADRLDRRLTMVVANLVRAVLMGSIPFVDAKWWLFVATVLMEAASLFFLPAKDASVPNLVPRERLEAANSLSLVTTYGAAPIAAAIFAVLGLLGGILDNVVGASFNANSVALWVNALTFLAAALLILPIQEISGRAAKPGSREPFLGAVWAGWSYVFRTPLVRDLVIGMLGAFAAGGTVAGLASTFVHDLGAGNPGYGLLFGTVFVGLAAGMGLAPKLLPGLSRRRLFGLAISTAGFALMLLALIPNLVIVVLLTLVLGIAAGAAWVTGYTILGLEVSDDVRGRTFAFVQTMARIVLLLVLALAPLVAGAFGSHVFRINGVLLQYNGAALTLLLAGLLAALLGLVAYRRMNDSVGGSIPGHLFHLGTLPAVSDRRGRSGFFLALEGGEGTGKTTQAERLAEALRARGYEVSVTREPGGTPVGSRLRKVLLDPESADLSPRAEALLYAADRADHVAHVIRPSLASGAIVITDRYVDSSLAYQGAGRTLPVDEVRRLSRWATEGLVPDLTVVLDLSPREGLARAGGEADRLEAEPLRFHSKVREAFLSLASANPPRYEVVDATLSPDDVTARILRRLEPMLPPTEEQRREAEERARADEEAERARQEEARLRNEELQASRAAAREERRQARRQAAEQKSEERAASRAASRSASAARAQSERDQAQDVHRWLEHRRRMREPEQPSDGPPAPDLTETATFTVPPAADGSNVRLVSMPPEPDAHPAGPPEQAESDEASGSGAHRLPADETLIDLRKLDPSKQPPA